MDNNISVAVYVRKSREEETEDTLKRQEETLVEICRKNKWEYEIYKEVGSSQDLERQQLQAMLDKVKSFHYDGIVVADLDRLSRNTGHFGTIKEILTNYGCFVQVPGKVYDFSNQEDDLFSDIQSVLAKNEYQTIKKRLTRGMRQSAKDGNWVGKKSPIGYKYNRDKKRLEPSEDEFIIKSIFDEYIEGMSTKDIANKFTLEGVTTSVGMIWSPSGISRLLNNPVYKGYSLYGKTKASNGRRGIKTKIEDQILVPNTHKAIVDEKTWNKVQRIKHIRNSKPLVLKLAKHKFSGLIKCGLCGRVHSFQSSRGGKVRISSCQTRHYQENSFKKYTMCPNKGVNIDKFEELFFNYFKQYIYQLKQYIDVIKTNDKPKINSSEKQLKTFSDRLKKLEKDIKRVQQGFLMEIFSEEEAQRQIKGFKTQKETIEKQMENLQVEINSSSTDYLTELLQRLNDFYNGHSKMPETEANEILSEFIEGIIYKRVGDHKAEMEMKIIWK